MSNEEKHRLISLIRKNEVAKTTLLIVLLILISYGSWSALKLALHTEYPVLVVVSGSMVPTLERGDLIVVRGVDPREITVGTIIVFHSPRDYETLIVHRVYALEQEGDEIYFRSKGDYNPRPDDWMIPANYVVGIFIARIPYVGIIVMKLREPFGVGVIVVLIVILVSYMFIEAGSKQRKQKSAEFQEKRTVWQALYK